MKQPNEYLSEFMELISLPQESRQVFLEAGKTLLEQQGAEMERLSALFMADPAENAGNVFEQLDKAAEACSIHSYTASYVFLCWNTQELRERYRAKGISDEVFRNTMMDLNYKLTECRHVHGIWGTFVRGWEAGFFTIARFGLGRLQYEFDNFRGESYTAGGITVKKGDRVLTTHIPSAGPLTKDLREDSYRRAYEFFKKDFPKTPVIFTCYSWLLYPPHDGMLPKNSNIVSFLHDFDPVLSVETETFGDAWRIYGADADKPFDQLPRETAFQRAYADWLMSGHKAGLGYGAVLFDGKRFLRADGSRENI